MTAKIWMGDIEATLNGGVWTCDYPDLERALNLFREGWKQRSYSPHVAYDLAHATAEAFGGEVAYVEPSMPGLPGAAY